MRRPATLVRLLCLAAAVALGFILPTSVAGHAELETSSPADGSSVPSPFDGPITLGFSAPLADGSKADLHAPGGSIVASATVDGPGAAMTISLDAPLDAGTYEVRWVSVADDGDLERGTVSFTVEAPVATPSPTPEPTPEPSDEPSTAPATPEPTIAASSGAAPTASSSPDTTGAAGTADVLLPIVVGLLVVAAGGAYLLTRRRSGAPR